MIKSFVMSSVILGALMAAIQPEALMGFAIFILFIFLNLTLFIIMYRPLLKQSLRWGSIGFIALVLAKLSLWALFAMVLKFRPKLANPWGIAAAVACLIMAGTYLALKERYYESRT